MKSASDTLTLIGGVFLAAFIVVLAGAAMFFARYGGFIVAAFVAIIVARCAGVL